MKSIDEISRTFELRKVKCQRFLCNFFVRTGNLGNLLNGK